MGLLTTTIVEILKCLPKTNCHQCNEPTCLVFACWLAEGIQSPSGCPALNDSDRLKLEKYMMSFQFHEN